MLNVIGGLFTFGGLYLLTKTINKSIDNDSKEFELENKHKELEEIKERIRVEVNNIYKYKLEEVDKLKNICDDCKIYQNKWQLCNNKEYVDEPYGITQLMENAWTRTKCPTHRDIIGDFMHKIISGDNKALYENEYNRLYDLFGFRYKYLNNNNNKN
jgi:hypothetical protein